MSIHSTSSVATTDIATRRVMVATSVGIRKITHIEKFLGVDAVVAPGELGDHESVDAVVVWGRKETAAPALKFASERNLDVVFLEDGWVRSASENAHNRRLYSVLVDDLGVYYDASQPSRIEQLLNVSDAVFAQSFDSDAQSYAAHCRQRLVDSNITKYNYCKRAVLPATLKQGDQQFVLVIDQTLDDASVRLGGMNQKRFNNMLDAAVRENPDSNVIVRTHPDVVAGTRQGYLSKRATELGVTISGCADNPMPWLKQAHRVYVGTSQIGYEALLCNTEVTVYGSPFYAGWGLTDDRQADCPSQHRRTATRTVDELFHIAHVAMARYVNPVSGDTWQLDECLSHVELQQRYFEKNAKDFYCLGITPWKQGYIRQYLRSPDGTVTFGRKLRSESSQSARTVNVTWSFRRFQDQALVNPGDRAKTGYETNGDERKIIGKNTHTQKFHEPLGKPPATTADKRSDNNGSRADGPLGQVIRIEDGFLRSAGLGSDFTAPGSLVVDSTGLYFDPGHTSDLEILLNTADVTPIDVQRAQRLKQRILMAGLSKYNVGQKAKKFANSADTLSVLVVGQVEDDASIKRGCSDIANNTSLLKAVRAAKPNAHVVYKPHPDVISGNRKGEVAKPLDWADEVNTSSTIAAGLDWCDELHTMTSLSGFEALMRGKHVVTYGMPFYSGWGLTEDRQTSARRQRIRTLEELVYLTLIEYPRYLDIESGEFITAEMMVALLEKQQLKTNAPDVWMQRQMTKVVNLVKGCRYAP